MFRLSRFILALRLPQRGRCRSTYALGLLAVLLGACLPAAPASPTPDMGLLMTQAVQTVMAGLVTPSPFPTDTPPPTATLPPRTPPALPAVFTTGALNRLDTPHTYIDDTCQYLLDKWNPQNAQPGTIVMVVMLHSINRAGKDDPNDITITDFKKMMNALKEQNFEAINANQLADFLDHNAKIPPRSVVLIQDDRHYADNFNEHFRPYWEQWGWPVVNAWISAEDGIRNIILPENINLAAEGWVDYQSHGYVHNTPMGDSSPEEYIRGEFEGSMKDLQQNFNKTPVAIIWPGGGFGVRPAQIGREYGYRLGFTVNPRGPLMYNWVPLADEADPGRPSFMPEGPVGDPRMTLPRYWPDQVLPNIDVVRTIGNEAAAYAEQSKATELEYYDIVCSPTYGPIPQ